VARYRITRLKALNSNKPQEIGEGMRDTIKSLDPVFIDVTEINGGNMVVIARHHSESSMETVTGTAQGAFEQMNTQW
jgi:hypothetical protein